MESLIHNFFNLAVYQEVFPHLLNGLWMTIGLSALIIPVGLLSGLLLAVGMTQTKSRFLYWSIVAYIDVFRAFPPLVLLIFVYFGWPFLGLELDKLTAVLIAFGLNNASYYAEVFRAGLESIPKGQMEAARSTGLSKLQSLLFVLIPQAVRNVFPDLVGNSIEVVKLTTLASVVALPELLRAARDAQSLLYNPSPVMLAALMYLALLWPLIRWLGYLEQRRSHE
ncbi:amino acid ABC transporter permease [Alcaligenes endophyticus]|uniref:Amino acid ABC transporter permease n=1 Tax=Alcaligenes endophyticus TaxID=1929088 RepID=A0ABT8EN34_9BURK|nr:amino acid ABC transporter permease [Alcaligenes endophyticus]MCX5591405.1 amino acid ABC transporter permease [Alcaligenes endophyticus]MDN4122714.1 amino acid ABC transporter permease [Alcaligenes endophyticus]